MRPPLSSDDKQRGKVLARRLAQLRASGQLSQAAVAERAHLSVDLVRKIEQAHVANPGFFTVAKLAQVLRADMQALAATAFEEFPP